MCGSLSEPENKTLAAVASPESNPPNNGEGDRFDQLLVQNIWLHAVFKHHEYHKLDECNVLY